MDQFTLANKGKFMLLGVIPSELEDIVTTPEIALEKDLLYLRSIEGDTSHLIIRMNFKEEVLNQYPDARVVDAKGGFIDYENDHCKFYGSSQRYGKFDTTLLDAFAKKYLSHIDVKIS